MNKKHIIKLGTRASQLAVSQSQLVANSLMKIRPDWEVQLVTLSTKGDRTSGSLTKVGGKGLFTAELETALRKGSIDFAVHSAKDMPAKQADDLEIAAIPLRADARDAIISELGDLDDLPQGAKIGTGSLRRSALLKKYRSDLNIIPIRGNIQTRLARAIGNSADLDAVVLAQAGLDRSGLAFEFAPYINQLEISEFPPAACQGLLAVQVCKNKISQQVLTALHELNHNQSSQIFQAERFVLQTLNASCNSCLAIHIEKKSTWVAHAMIAKPTGENLKTFCLRDETAKKVSTLLAEKLLACDAKKILDQNFN